MKLIADSGSSKTDWIILERDTILKRFKTIGINPCILDSSQITKTFTSELLPQITGHNIKCIEFYGAGCKQPFSQKIYDILKSLTNCQQIIVESDMLCAARMCCSNSEGIVCILGTGSNSCLFDGKNIIQQTPSLGYILGDEGSGGALGKRLLNYIYKGNLPIQIQQYVHKKYNLSIEEIIQKVYRQEYPNKFMATFTHFLKENDTLPEIKQLIKEEFQLFINRNLIPYNRRDLPIHFVGSVAYHFQQILKSVIYENGMKLGNIYSNPLDNFSTQ
jgi:N-acetylglucosamine kinase-like BadF-type ATPase